MNPQVLSEHLPNRLPGEYFYMGRLQNGKEVRHRGFSERDACKDFRQ